MHDSGGHMSSSDTYSHSSHTVHTSHNPTWEQGAYHPTPNPGDPASYYYDGSIPRRRGGGPLAVVLILLAAVLPIVFWLMAFMH